MKKLFLFFVFGIGFCFGQTSHQHGSGAPSAGDCNSVSKYGRVYDDVSVDPPVEYTCGLGGWKITSGGAAITAGTGISISPSDPCSSGTCTVTNTGPTAETVYYAEASAIRQVYNNLGNLMTPPTRLVLYYTDLTEIPSSPGGFFCYVANPATIIIQGNTNLADIDSTAFMNCYALTTIDITQDKVDSLGFLSGVATPNILDTLVVSVGSLATITSGTLDAFTAMTYLDLSTNLLTSLPANLLLHNTILAYAIFTSNPITTVPASFFDTNIALTNVLFDSNALTALSVNQILSSLVTCCTTNAGTVDLSGGTNSAPTIGPPNGIAAAATLIGGGWTVTTN